MISYKQFKEIELRVAQIVEVEDIPGKDRLYKLRIDLGKEKRQIIAGLKQFYAKEELKGKKIVVVANLEPAVIAGFKSEAMLLAAKDKQGKYRLLTVEGDVENGTIVE